MNKVHIHIAEHLMEVSGDLLFLMTIFQRNVQSDTRVHNVRPDISLHITEGYGIPFVDYEVDIHKQPDKITFRRADYLIEADSEYKHAYISAYDELALKHALMNLYSAYIVYHSWGLLIHSSCVVEGGKAHMFAGPSGAGKSTAAKLSYPRKLLSDEATLVKITPGSIMVYDSPFRSELPMTGEQQQSSPLTSINLLVQAVQNERIHIRKSNGLLLLMDKVFYWAHDPEETFRILKLMRILSDKVPIYELHFQKNNTFWELIS